MLPPVIVNISRLHRETAAVVRQVEKADYPVFVTQYARVAAVLLNRQMYERLLRSAQKGEAAGAAARRGAPGSGSDAATAQNPWMTVAVPLAGPLSVFGPLPPGTRFLSSKGFQVDAELAAFLMEEGEQVRPILDRWRDPEEEDEP